MTDNEFLLFDRIQKIQSVIHQYGEENFYVSFSGGKDSTVLSYLIDMALPNNTIPRVYADTGIELNMVRDFVYTMQEKDQRIVIIKPSKNIKNTLEKDGYPFKSKIHSLYVDRYQRLGETKGVLNYKNNLYAGYNKQCPKLLQYQFSKDFDLRISLKCCDRLKKEPLSLWQKVMGIPYSIVGIMKDEQGARDKGVCLAFSNNKLKSFHPLIPVNKEWEEWFIKEYNIDICDIYKPPYNFTRTGCKGCPYIINLQNELDTLEKFFPSERKQCEIIWKPVYDEYRRIGYRLKKQKEGD